jgi:hypothetical protein
VVVDWNGMEWNGMGWRGPQIMACRAEKLEAIAQKKVHGTLFIKNKKIRATGFCLQSQRSGLCRRRHRSTRTPAPPTQIVAQKPPLVYTSAIARCPSYYQRLDTLGVARSDPLKKNANKDSSARGDTRNGPICSCFHLEYGGWALLSGYSIPLL